MQINVQCNQCGAKINAPEEMAGKAANCPQCNAPLHVPLGDKAFADYVPSNSPSTWQADGKTESSRVQSLADFSQKRRQYVCTMIFVAVVVTISAAALAIGFVFGSASANTVELVSTDIQRITDALTAAGRRINALTSQCETLRKDLVWFQERSDAIEWAAGAKSAAELVAKTQQEATKPTQVESDEQRRKRIAVIVVGSLSSEEQNSFAEILDEVPNWADPNSDLPDTENFYYYTGGKCQALIDAAMLARFRSIEPQVASWLEQELGRLAVYQVAVTRGEAWVSSAQAWSTLNKNGDFFDAVRRLEQIIGLLPPLAEFYAMRATKNPQLVDRLALMLAEAEANLPRDNWRN